MKKFSNVINENNSIESNFRKKMYSFDKMKTDYIGDMKEHIKDIIQDIEDRYLSKPLSVYFNDYEYQVTLSDDVVVNFEDGDDFLYDIGKIIETFKKTFIVHFNFTILSDYSHKSGTGLDSFKLMFYRYKSTSVEKPNSNDTFNDPESGIRFTIKLS